MLLNGYDEISLTLLLEDDIQAFEDKRSSCCVRKQQEAVRRRCDGFFFA